MFKDILDALLGILFGFVGTVSITVVLILAIGLVYMGLRYFGQKIDQNKSKWVLMFFYILILTWILIEVLPEVINMGSSLLGEFDAFLKESNNSIIDKSAYYSGCFIFVCCLYFVARELRDKKEN